MLLQILQNKSVVLPFLQKFPYHYHNF